MKLDPFPIPAFDPAPILEIIGRLGWRTARAKDRWGKPQIPHSYSLRNSYLMRTRNAEADPAAEADFIALFHLIQAHGREERFGRATRFYLYPDDGRKYWAMSDLATSGVINRMLVADDLDRMRNTGQIE